MPNTLCPVTQDAHGEEGRFLCQQAVVELRWVESMHHLFIESYSRVLLPILATVLQGSCFAKRRCKLSL